jgi:hypothetical protein
MTPAAEKLLRHSDKFREVTFGIDFSHTDPALIERLVGLKGAKVATKFAGGTYHPKVYCFRSGDKAAAIVGSANFTRGGLNLNHEAAVLVEGNASDPFFTDLLRFTKQSAALGEPVTQEFAAAYRLSHRRASLLPRPPRDPLTGLTRERIRALSAPLLKMTWAEYEHLLSKSRHHDVPKSLELLRLAQQWLASVTSFSDLSIGRRQAIAGLVVDRRERSEPGLGNDWGWFGSMRGMGDFASLIIANNEHLARAIDSVPQKGEVTKSHFDTFVKHFERAFSDSARTGGYATGSRLLAMKRPDVFICICNPNKVEAAKAMGFAPTMLELTDYWDKVVDVLRTADWYNAEKPDGPDGELWECRVAMLDAVFYKPA